MVRLVLMESPTNRIQEETVLSLGEFDGSRNAGFIAAVSDLALIIWAAMDGYSAHEGINPQRINDSSRRGSFGFCRMTGTG